MSVAMEVDDFEEIVSKLELFLKRLGKADATLVQDHEEALAEAVKDGWKIMTSNLGLSGELQESTKLTSLLHRVARKCAEVQGLSLALRLVVQQISVAVWLLSESDQAPFTAGLKSTLDEARMLEAEPDKPTKRLIRSGAFSLGIALFRKAIRIRQKDQGYVQHVHDSIRAFQQALENSQDLKVGENAVILTCQALVQASEAQDMHVAWKATCESSFMQITNKSSSEHHLCGVLLAQSGDFGQALKQIELALAKLRTMEQERGNFEVETRRLIFDAAMMHLGLKLYKKHVQVLEVLMELTKSSSSKPREGLSRALNQLSLPCFLCKKMEPCCGCNLFTANRLQRLATDGLLRSGEITADWVKTYPFAQATSQMSTSEEGPGPQSTIKELERQCALGVPAGQYRKVISVASKAIELDDALIWPHVYLSEAWARLGYISKAISCTDEVLAKAPSRSSERAKALMNKAMLLLCIKGVSRIDLHASLKLFEDALATCELVAQDKEYAIFNLTALHLKLGQAKKAGELWCTQRGLDATKLETLSRAKLRLHSLPKVCLVTDNKSATRQSTWRRKLAQLDVIVLERLLQK